MIRHSRSANEARSKRKTKEKKPMALCQVSASTEVLLLGELGGRVVDAEVVGFGEGAPGE
jgi:hypothetical protein